MPTPAGLSFRWKHGAGVVFEFRDASGNQGSRNAFTNYVQVPQRLVNAEKMASAASYYVCRLAPRCDFEMRPRTPGLERFPGGFHYFALYLVRFYAVESFSLLQAFWNHTSTQHHRQSLNGPVAIIKNDPGCLVSHSSLL
jgi:predicted membrane metal-binding protein